ncbi:MAG: methyltransferase domain-containing protein [Solirubrobacteraceae bacterium]|nr:methyltransferase domain-containing protein [Solirubrobacteraceae bacterium]
MSAQHVSLPSVPVFGPLLTRQLEWRPRFAAQVAAGDPASVVEIDRRGRLPQGDEPVDRVVASLVLHRLDPSPKAAALAEAHEVLAPGGRIHIADWGMPRDPVEGVAFLGLRLLDGMTPTRQHATGALPALLRGAGFTDVAVHDSFRTPFGRLELLSAVRG